MGWKSVRDHYRIVHGVQTTPEGICIGSPYIHNIIVIDRHGVIVKWDDRPLNADLIRYQQEMQADPETLRRMVAAKDTFSDSVSVYTYDGARIVEKRCEVPGWPNVTHDGLMMYENTFSTDRVQVVQWAKRNALAAASWRREAIAETEEKLASLRRDLAAREADFAELERQYPDIPADID